MHKLVRCSLCLVALVVAAACATTTTPTHTGDSIETHVLAQSGPRLLNGAVYAAGDLNTLKALVDAGNAVAVTQVGGVASTRQCMAPFTNGHDVCWPGISSSAGRAYIAIAIQGGFCRTVDPPQAYVSGGHLELEVTYHDQSDCHIQGVLALPTASLIAISTSGLEAGIYSLDYVFESSTDTYRSAETYLSIPSPAGGDQAAMEADAISALERTVKTSNAGLFSEARVNGAQLGSLCGAAVEGTQFLVVYMDPSTRRMDVVLATPVPRICTATAV